MPIYEYSCEKCRHIFEEWVRHIDDNVDQVCPDCGAPAHRIVSNTSFVLKGGGWYVTDYGYRKGKDEGKPSTSGAASSTGGDSAPTPAAPSSPTASESSSSPAGSGTGASAPATPAA